MTGPEFFAKAQQDIEFANSQPINTGEAAFFLARAQVQATLALTAAIALAQGPNYIGSAFQKWQEVAS